MNKNFVIYNASGEILRTGNCPASALQAQAGAGEFMVEAVACCEKDAINPDTGDVIVGGRPPINTPANAPVPVKSLPVDHQLDLLWQAMDSGTFPKAEPFYSAVKAQKERR